MSVQEGHNLTGKQMPGYSSNLNDFNHEQEETLTQLFTWSQKALHIEKDCRTWHRIAGLDIK